MRYQFNEHLSGELELEYLFGAGYHFHSTFSDSNSYNQYHTTIEDRFTGISMIRFNPAFKISTGTQVKVYMRLGALIGVAGRYTEESSFTNTNYNLGTGITSYDTQDISWKYSRGIALGFNGAAGVEYKVCNQILLFGEARFTSLSWAPAHSEKTRDIYNGTNLILTSTINQLQTDFVNHSTLTYPQDPTIPSQQPKHFVAFNSLGIKVGVVYLFGK